MGLLNWFETKEQMNLPESFKLELTDGKNLVATFNKASFETLYNKSALQPQFVERVKQAQGEQAANDAGKPISLELLSNVGGEGIYFAVDSISLTLPLLKGAPLALGTYTKEQFSVLSINAVFNDRIIDKARIATNSALATRAAVGEDEINATNAVTSETRGFKGILVTSTMPTSRVVRVAPGDLQP